MIDFEFLVKISQIFGNFFIVISYTVAYLEYKQSRSEKISNFRIQYIDDIVKQIRDRKGCAYIHVPDKDIIYMILGGFNRELKYVCVTGIPKNIKFDPTKMGKDIKEMPKLEKLAKAHFNSIKNELEDRLNQKQ